ncbi:c-fos induced growth factor, isoform CRA_c [Rattus norvegicus]|uniref:C-fos induced growth factor, isoform CRA_c n=1 Tax=Rattus norvegicus TaxID=10116 RepID=A6K2K9_RAT|nr:c-fos induced growth factor, isoform CRA_c [Rattus norvegicus]
MYGEWAAVNILMMSYVYLVQGFSSEHRAVKDVSFERSSRSVLERSEQQIRAASSLEELLQVAHSEDWKLWRCRLKLKSLASVDSRSTSHRSTRFAATFYDTETLKASDASVHQRSEREGSKEPLFWMNEKRLPETE